MATKEEEQPVQVEGGAEERSKKASELKAQGNAEFKKGEYRAALPFYTEALTYAEGKEKGDLYGNRSAAYKNLEEWQNAIDDVTKAIELNPDNLKFYPRASECYVTIGDFPKALQMLKALQAKHKEAGNKTEETSVLRQIRQVESHIVTLARAHEAVGDGNFMAALGPIRVLRSLSKASVEFRKLELQALVGAKQYAEALKLANGLVTSGHQEREILRLRGICLYQTGDNAKAAQHFKAILNEDPDDIKAQQMFRQIRRMDRLKEEGNELFKAGKAKEAYDIYTQALECDPENGAFNSILYNNRAAAAMRMGKYQEAVDDCTKALEYNPDYTKAFSRRADCYMKLERWDEAVRDFEILNKQQRGDHELRSKLRQAQLEQRKAKRKDYYKILEISKDASADEIKKSYRKLALKYHPDRNGETEEKRLEAEQKFKDLAEAYETLSDEKKKARYDSGADLEDGMGMGGAGGIDPNDLFSMFFGGGMGGMGGMGGFPGGGRRGGMGGMGGFPGGMHFEFG